jgi:hypothetical protein
LPHCRTLQGHQLLVLLPLLFRLFLDQTVLFAGRLLGQPG